MPWNAQVALVGRFCGSGTTFQGESVHQSGGLLLCQICLLAVELGIGRLGWGQRLEGALSSSVSAGPALLAERHPLGGLVTPWFCASSLLQARPRQTNHAGVCGGGRPGKRREGSRPKDDGIGTRSGQLLCRGQCSCTSLRAVHLATGPGLASGAEARVTERGMPEH